jgi:nitrite reductase/ring-hydroxylating ferredoxin subunit/uncharacterized membrane protein
VRLHALAEKVGGIDALDQIAEPSAGAVRQVVGHGRLKDALSGTWLGHPLHPLLTDVPIGLFTGATVLDLLAGDRGEHAADVLVAAGLAAAVPTAAAGAADWSDSFGEDMRIGVVHAGANVAGLALYALSLRRRRRGERTAGTALGLAAMATMTIGGYLGGTLSHNRGVGVNHAFAEHGPPDWTAVLAEAQLAERRPQRVEAGDASVLLYRSNGSIHAIGSRCTHAGGPLDEGTVDAQRCTVRCPWHGSVFRLDDGSVVHGPASVPQPAYEARARAGQIEIRRRRP